MGFLLLGFPGCSDSKESAFNSGDPGRSPGEGTGYSLQHSGLQNPMDREAWQTTVQEGLKKSNSSEQLTLSLFHFHALMKEEPGGSSVPF